MMKRLHGVEMKTKKLWLPGDLINAETYLAAAKANSIANAVVDMELDGGDDCKCKYPATVLGVSCTSMSFCVGEKTVDEQLKAFDPATPVTDMARGQLQALLALGARKVALMTPYIEEVSAANQRMLEAGGVEVVYRLTMGLEKDEQTTAVDPDVIKEWALAANCDEADCVVIGCSAFRACGDGFIDDLEKALGKPVVTSTQAFLWAMLRTGGVKDQFEGYGQLLRRC